MSCKANSLRLPLVLAGLLAMSTFCFAQTAEVLVKITAPSPQTLAGLPLQICLHSETYMLATMNPDLLGTLQQRGVAYEILDTEPFSEPYYFFTRTAHAAGKTLPATGKMLLKESDAVLLKVSEQNAQRLAQQGWQLNRILPRALPLRRASVGDAPQMPTSAASLQLIQSVRAQISDSSVARYLQRLEAFRTRYSFSDSIVAARNWLAGQFQSMGYTDVRFDPFPVYQSLQQNVVATKPAALSTARVIVIGGHYDSILFDADPMLFAPGVDDDGTGTAGTLELARVFAGTDLEATLMFVPFAAEEQGLWGSSHFAEMAYQSGMNIVLMLNMDMIGNVADQVLNMNVLTDDRSRGYAQLFAKLTTQHTNLIPVLGASSGNSDHFPFQQYGFPALFIHEGDFSPNWHRSTDVMSNINVPYITSVLQATAAMIVTVANAPGAPQGLTAIELGDGRSQLVQWQANSEPDWAGYHLYLGAQSGVYDTVLALQATSDTLRGLQEGQTYYLTLSAFDAQNNESVLAPEINFKPQSVPRTPGGFAATSQQSSILLQWHADNTEADFAGYTLTRIGPGATQQEYSLTNLTSFRDTNVQPHVLYRYAVQARDHDGNLSAPSALLRGQLATHDRGVLVVDGTKDGPGRPLQPPDEDVDAFYARILQGFNNAGQWDLADSARQSLIMSDADLGIYSTIVWHSDVSSPLRRLAEDTLALKKYLQNGGRLLLSGWGLAEGLAGKNFVENNFSPGQFGYDYLQLASTRIGSGSDRDFKGADALLPNYPAVTVDAVKVPVFNNNLLAMEVFTALAFGSSAQELYTYRSSASPPSFYHGKPVALRFLGPDFKCIVLDFPLYFMAEAEAQQLVRQALQDLGETSTAVAAAPTEPLPLQFELEQSYPNPVRMVDLAPGDETQNADVAIRFHVPRAAHVTVRIYNLLGQTVRTLISATQAAGTQVLRWNGKNDAGQTLGAGIYFYEMRAQDFRRVRKLVIVP